MRFLSDLVDVYFGSFGQFDKLGIDTLEQIDVIAHQVRNLHVLELSRYFNRVLSVPQFEVKDLCSSSNIIRLLNVHTQKHMFKNVFIIFKEFFCLIYHKFWQLFRTFLCAPQEVDDIFVLRSLQDFPGEVPPRPPGGKRYFSFRFLRRLPCATN